MILILSLCACSTNTPYQHYAQAYEQFMQAESLTANRVDNLIQTSNTGADYNLSVTSAMDFARQENGDILTAEITMVNPDETSHTQMYFINGILYTKYIEGPEQNFRQVQDSDFARKYISEGVLEFPENVIAKQSSEPTATGEILHFEFDSEKYYAYVYPDTYEELGYGGFSTYRELPVYDVHLDKNGRILEITASFCTVNSSFDAFTEERKYHIVFSQYEQAAPDFSGLRENEYPLSDE